MSNDNNDLCANCGKGEEESISLKKCGGCISVQYCSAACQKAHRSQHKKECRLRAAELHQETLFKQHPPPQEECPICFLRLPSLTKGYRNMSCCGKIICSGCIHAGGMAGEDQLCPFCRAPALTSTEEGIKRTMKRVEMGDPIAIYNLGCCYDEGKFGLPQNRDKALELWHRAAELGHAGAYCNIGFAYFNGEGVERDEKKATHYYELAAMGGDVTSRRNLGNAEVRAVNIERALKHFMIAAGGGDDASVKMIQRMYKGGYATKDDYAKALKAYQEYLEEIKSDDRDKAAAFKDEFRYY